MTATVVPTGEVQLDHGTGAKLSQELIALIVRTLGDVYIGEMEDSAFLSVDTGRIAMTSDSFVADPPFFGNGDIGKIAVCGTVNDLAVAGSRPRYLTLCLIIETGFPLARLVRVLESVRDTAREADVLIVGGDTKVVRSGEADQIYLNTAGVGVFERAPRRMRDVRPGDKVILTGSIGNHTVHLLSIREGLGFETRVLSDCAPLNGLVEAMFAVADDSAIRSIRDVTRGGLSAVLHEYAHTVGRSIRINHDDLPIQHETAMAMDMLGINPIHAANEGCACVFVAPEAESAVLEALRAHHYGRDAVTIGEVTDLPDAKVLLRDASGRDAEVEELQGAELPRLC
ncbi:hydrogenase expression/formation protein HypE [Actinokineospora globicatena]|uniref:Hydrogenase expression/formation protein HypE n=1 Tax=Actinokineospora globicatena TaxID=103729 RepID=A0A9W6QF90_9PSEU|nr:hydrogenase expression/formation protein HypE [Actinokineospora globicatena]GLW89866.1 hydrogenase expression/formation protein HypE [Actinokineospora globicatena]